MWSPGLLCTQSTHNNKPEIVGYMSADITRQYHLDLSQLKFLNDIPRGKLSLDLNHNIDMAVKRTTDDSEEKINLLLNFLLDKGESLNFTGKDIDNVEPTIVTYRRTLISIMCNAFGRGSIIIYIYAQWRPPKKSNEDYLEVNRRQSFVRGATNLNNTCCQTSHM